MINLAIVQSALELGIIYALVSLALFLSYSILDIADLTTDGSFTLGCAVSATVALAGHPFLALPAAMAAGVAAGFITAMLQTKFGVPSILAGIVTNTGLYTINLAVMGFSSNVNLFRADTIFSLAQGLFEGTPLAGWYKLIVAAVITLIICSLLIAFLGTRLGLSIRATGDNKDMVRASSINPTVTITIGLCMANAMTALSGAILAQYQKAADINIGTGMVVIGLAGLIIGQTLVGRGGMFRNVLAVLCGSIIYRFIMAIALRSNIDVSALKLVSAVIVGVAISIPALKARIALEKSKLAARKAEKEENNA
jgi:putative ABC transport system permease protein